MFVRHSRTRSTLHERNDSERTETREHSEKGMHQDGVERYPLFSTIGGQTSPTSYHSSHSCTSLVPRSVTSLVSILVITPIPVGRAKFSHPTDVIQAVAEAGQGRVLVTNGRVVDVERYTTAGFARGHV